MGPINDYSSERAGSFCLLSFPILSPDSIHFGSLFFIFGFSYLLSSLWVYSSHWAHICSRIDFPRVCIQTGGEREQLSGSAQGNTCSCQARPNALADRERDGKRERLMGKFIMPNTSGAALDKGMGRWAFYVIIRPSNTPISMTGHVNNTQLPPGYNNYPSKSQPWPVDSQWSWRLGTPGNEANCLSASSLTSWYLSLKDFPAQLSAK